MFRTWGWILFYGFLVGGCVTQRMAAQMAFPLIQGQYLSMQEEMDLDLAERAIPSNLKMMEGLLKGDETNTPILNHLAEGFCSYSFSFIEDREPERASALYERGRKYALRSLAETTGIKNLIALTGDDFRAALKKAEEGDLPALFWIGQCWAGWLMLNLSNLEAFADISRVEWLLGRALELGETYHYAGPHLVLGGFYGSRTKLLGGDPQKSRIHFEQNLKLNQRKLLLAQLFYAKTFAVQSQDRELFETLLKEVLETPSEVLPEQRLANEVAKRKARDLLEKTDELF